jgi:hypothetical protein
MRIQVLVDADNLAPRRLQPVLDLFADCPGAELTASGRQQALDALDWPADATLLAHAGWQRADMALADAYEPDDAPLVLVTGDGDFALLAARHRGPVLVLSGAASGRLREAATVVDPAVEGIAPVAAWLRAVTTR